MCGKADHDVLNGCGGLDVEQAGYEDHQDSHYAGHLRGEEGEDVGQILTGGQAQDAEVQHFHELVPLPHKAQSGVHKP